MQSRLSSASARVDELRARSAEVAARQEAAKERLALVRETLGRAEKDLGDRLRTLYVEGDPDPLAVLLGARSLDEALTALDSLDRLAQQDQRIVEQVEAARRDVRAAIAELATERERLAALTTEAESARDALAAAEGQRESYLAELRERQRLNTAEIGQLTDAASAAEQKAEEIASAPAPQPADASPSTTPDNAPAPQTSDPAPPPHTSSSGPTSGGRTVAVQATGYSLHGTTATGVPTGWGVVAVDPSFIPLGTKMTIPGYGEGVAADTGSAVKGATIDLWFPTTAQALQWGRRTVTITLH